MRTPINSIVAIFFIFSVASGAGFLLYRHAQITLPEGPTDTESGRVVCTEERKLCLDGTAVGRTGPNCEFAACSGEEVCAPGDRGVCTTDIREMCSPDGTQRKTVPSSCGCGEDAEWLEKYGWKDCAANEGVSIDTSTWKTYRNEEYGFEVRYPVDSVFEHKPGSGEVLFFSYFQDIGVRNLSSPLLFLRIEKLQYGTIAEYRPTLLTNPDVFHDIKIFGVDALLNENEETGVKTIWFVKDNLFFRFAGKSLDNGFSVDQLLSTFKFIN